MLFARALSWFCGDAASFDDKVCSFPRWQLADISCAVHICSLLHCRYQGFAELLLEQLQKNYSGPIKKSDDKVKHA